MSEEMREKIMLEDGRKAERVVKEVDGVEVVETFVEPKQELRLAHRQTVKRRPCVYHRETQVIDETTGEVVETTVEDLGEPELKIRERLVAEDHLPKEESPNVTRDELREDIKDAMLALASVMGNASVEEDEDEEEEKSTQTVVEDRIESKKETTSNANLLYLAIIGAEVAGLAWILFAL